MSDGRRKAAKPPKRMDPVSKDSSELEAARAAKRKARRIFARYGFVTGVGITLIEGTYAVKVHYETEPDSAGGMPEEIDGVPVVIHCVGRVRKQSSTPGSRPPRGASKRAGKRSSSSIRGKKATSSGARKKSSSRKRGEKSPASSTGEKPSSRARKKPASSAGGKKSSSTGGKRTAKTSTSKTRSGKGPSSSRRPRKRSAARTPRKR